MARNAKRRLVVLGVLAAASLVGLVVLAALTVRDAPRWALAGLASPLAVRCVAVMAAGVAALGAIVALLVGTSRAGKRRSGVKGVAADQGGTAAIEMTLLLPFAVMIFLVITQAALLFNANLVVHYAVFAASRVSIVVVPMEIGGELQNLVYNPDVELNPPSEKLELIRRAAALALVPISAAIVDEEAEATPGGGGGAAVEAETKALFNAYATAAEEPWWFRRIRKQYDYANRFVEITLARPEHWRYGNPDTDCPYRHYLRDAWTQTGWSYIPYCPFHDARMDYAYWEDISLRLQYPYLLEVPIARRVMGGEELEVPGRTGTSWCAWIKVISTLSNEGGPEKRPKDG